MEVIGSVIDLFSDDMAIESSPSSIQQAAYAAGLHQYVPVFDEHDELSNSVYTSQEEALYWLLHGDNVVLCGSAGAGKSWVIDKYQDIICSFRPRLNNEYRNIEIAATASTGVAASLIFGKTIHSWSGLGISVDPFDETTMTEKQKRIWYKAKQRIKATDILIIDEVSMLPSYFLSNLDAACRKARGKDQPFGGLQIVLVGDFLQLPPVDTHQLDSSGQPVDSGYCFHARGTDGKKLFSSAGFKFCYLDRIRRSKDMRLNDLLNGIRDGVDVDTLRPIIYPRFHVQPASDKVYTRLRTVNRSVDEYNQNRLDELPSELHRYPLQRHGDPDDCKEIIKNGHLKFVELKEGAVIMLTSNNALPGYVNGSMGVVTSLGSSVDGSGQKIPIIKVRMNSRSSDDMDIENLDPSLDEELREVTIHYIDATKTHTEVKPVIADDGSTILKEVEITDALVRYLPLRLAWAITVHKSQGQTLDGAVINLSNCFQRGLGYVALSRCRSIDDVIMEGHDLSDEAFMIDSDAKKADDAVRRRALKAREGLMDNEHRVKDLEAALRGAGSKAARLRIEKDIGKDISLEAMFHDEESCYQYVKKYRTRMIRNRL
jgi:ATP-dependent exoDNAse (exonuclease V) alpha subunit